jgi:hypothetical protein
MLTGIAIGETVSWWGGGCRLYVCGSVAHLQYFRNFENTVSIIRCWVLETVV